MEFTAGSTSATAPASQILAPVIMLTTIIAINICPAKKINANSLVWQVLNCNTIAINFYNKYNAELKNNWTNGRLYKEQINGLKL